MVTLALLSSPGCGARTIDPSSICAHARWLPVIALDVTPSGRVLGPHADGWTIGQLEADGTLTPITTLATSSLAFSRPAWLEHDPLSGRMWLLEDRSSFDDNPPTLYQLGADGQLEWMLELDDHERPVDANSLLHHDGAVYVALTMDGPPPGPSDPIVNDTLVIERRDLTGALLWSRDDYAPPSTAQVFASAWLVGVSGSALGMVATPPLIDYGSSFPLTIDVETGDVLWSGADGHDPLRMAVDDAQLYLGWVQSQTYDPERRPELVVLTPTTSSLSVHAPSTGAQANLSTAEWSAIDWEYPIYDQSFAFGKMGARLVSLLEHQDGHDLAVHDEHGELLCQGGLDLEQDFEVLDRGVGLDGRSQFVVMARRPDEDPDVRFEFGLLLLEPADDI